MHEEPRKKESKLGCSYLCNLMENEDEKLWKLSTISCMFKKTSNKINRVSRQKEIYMKEKY